MLGRPREPVRVRAQHGEHRRAGHRLVARDIDALRRDGVHVQRLDRLPPRLPRLPRAGDPGHRHPAPSEAEQPWVLARSRGAAYDAGTHVLREFLMVYIPCEALAHRLRSEIRIQGAARTGSGPHLRRRPTRRYAPTAVCT